MLMLQPSTSATDVIMTSPANEEASAPQPQADAVACTSGDRTQELERQLADALQQLAETTSRAQDAERMVVQQAAQIRRLETRLANAEPSPRRRLSQLKSTKHRQKREAALRSQLGSTHALVARSEVLDAAASNALRRHLRLPERTYSTLAKVLGGRLATLHELRTYEAELVNQCGGIEETKIDGIEARWLAQPVKAFRCYILHLLATAWSDRLPSAIDVVVAADKGGDTTKLGFFVPTGVAAPQAPRNFVLAAAYRGPETREFLSVAAARLFEFADQLIEDGCLRMRVNGESVQLPVEVLFVDDLKMLPVIFGTPHASSTRFCPMCKVSKHEHRLQPTRGVTRQLLHDGDDSQRPLLNVPIENFVVPPLHLLMGAVNKILEVIHADQRERLFKRAGVVAGWRKTSMLTGRDGNTLLKWISTHPDAVEDLSCRAVLIPLAEVSKYARASQVCSTPTDLARFAAEVAKFASAWRRADLPTTPKLHLFEVHLVDFVRQHGSWGRYGEQGLEAMHHLGNLAASVCVGANQGGDMKHFLKRHALVLADLARIVPAISSPLADEDDQVQPSTSRQSVADDSAASFSTLDDGDDDDRVVNAW